MWLLAELFEQLPEVGDIAKPKVVFFFDEAHLLFADATRSSMESNTTSAARRLTRKPPMRTPRMTSGRCWRVSRRPIRKRGYR
jgi:DNA helicase HerA-like ATPase